MTVFTLEAIEKKNRQGFFAEYRANVRAETSELSDTTVKLSITLGPDKGAHPDNNHYLNKHWLDAEKLGFKLLHCSRIGGIVNPDLKQEWFVAAGIEKANRFGQCGRDIEANDCGMKQLRKIGDRYAVENEG